MMSQASQMQEEMQRKMEHVLVDGTSGGGAVTATMNGRKQLMKIRIDPAAVIGLSGAQPDVEMLEALVVAAVNDAGRKADDALQSSVKGMLGGLNRSEEHTSELQSLRHLVCRLLLEKK